MISIPQILSVCLFEFKRSLTFGRLVAYFVLALFPPAMVLLIAKVSALTHYKPNIMFLTFVVCILALLLWATPNVYSELESRNWLFVTSRPRGRLSILLGKFLAASLSAMLVCVVAIALSGAIVAVVVGSKSTEELNEDNIRANAAAPVEITDAEPKTGNSRGRVLVDLASFLTKFTVIAIVACLEYAAVFSLIGVLFQRRAMVIAAIYALANEMLFALIPALISQFSIRYHLLGLSLGWLGWFLPGEKPDIDIMEMWFASLPLWVNLAVLTIVPVALLAAAGYIIRYREYITADEVQLIRRAIAVCLGAGRVRREIRNALVQ